MSEINTPICTHCGHPKSSHRTRELSCPVYGRSGDLQGWSFHSFTTDPPPEPKLYTAAEMKAAQLETMERCITKVAHSKLSPPKFDPIYHTQEIQEQIEDILIKLKEKIENENG